MSPFTKPVLQNLETLRHAIRDLQSSSPEAAATLTAITDALVSSLEDQMLLVFANIGVKRREEEQRLLQSRNDMSLLDQYREACGASTELRHDGSSGKLSVPTLKEYKPDVRHAGESGPELPVQKVLLGGIHVLLESIGHMVGAERTILYVAQKGTGTLRVICSAPDATPARKGAFLPAHQGLVGAVYSTGIAVRADAPESEVRKAYIEPVDAQLGLRTDNMMAFPIVDKGTGRPNAVLECANKPAGFSETDESTLAAGADLLWYFLCYHELDFHNGVYFNPSGLHQIKPFRPSEFGDLAGYHDAGSTKPPRLISRLKSTAQPSMTTTLARHLGLAPPSGDVPGPSKHSEGYTVAGDVRTIRELKSYLESVEDAQKHVMTELVRTQDREEALREECAKKGSKLRVLEENIQALHEQLAEARVMINKSSFAPMQTANADEFDTSASPRQSEARSPAREQTEPRLRSSGRPDGRLPAIERRPPRATLATATAMLEELRSIGLRQSSTPPPRRGAKFL